MQFANLSQSVPLISRDVPYPVYPNTTLFVNFRGSGGGESGSESGTGGAGGAGFSRDAVGRRSMSEKRHAAMDAKQTGTYKKIKEIKAINGKLYIAF